MKERPSLIICSRCDAVYRRPRLAFGQVGTCQLCGQVIARPHRLTIEGCAAMTATAGILLLLGNTLPMLTFGLGNRRQDLTLWQATLSIVHGHSAPLITSATFFATVVPLIQIVLLGWVVFHAWDRRRAPGFRSVMRVLSMARPLSIVQVALLGIIATSIKLSNPAAMTLGPGLWSLMALSAVTALMGRRDIRWLWSATESGLKLSARNERP
jgi:paraquat-inducible protein A